MPVANLETGMKVCSRKDCEHRGNPQPVTEFSKNKGTSDGLAYQCRKCLGKTDREQKASRGITSGKKMVVARTNLMVRALAENRTVCRTEQLVESAIRHAGGVDRLAQDYLRTLDDPEMKPHNKIKAYQGLFNVIADNDRMNPVKADVSQLTEDELKEWLRQIMREEAGKEDAITLDSSEYRVAAG